MEKTANTGERAVLLRYHEVALKGANRKWFEERLGINTRRLLQRALGKNGPKVEISHLRGRVVVKTPWNEAVEETLGRVFGVSSYSPMLPVPTGKDELAQAAIGEFGQYVEKHGLPKTFRVLTRRSDKALPETSMELDRYIGGHVKEAFPSLTVDLDEPEVVVGVELRNKNSYIWTRKVPGPGGLPVGTNGDLLTLISGGLDSPIAAIKALKRGSPTSFIHFHGTPFVGTEVLEKVEDLCRMVNRYQPESSWLHVVPFGKVQEKIALATLPKFRTILYRRMMVRVACKLAERIGAQALVTGESLGQVASQTLENLATVDEVSTIPILRPLITYDKEEIIVEARNYGTFEVSIRPGVDCCTLFADRHPAIRATPAQAREQEALFPLDELVAEAVSAIDSKKL